MTSTEVSLLASGGLLVVGILTAVGAILGHLWKRVTDLEAARDALFKLREDDALVKRAQGDHIDVLEAHIWARKDPPPPPRPVGV